MQLVQQFASWKRMERMEMFGKAQSMRRMAVNLSVFKLLSGLCGGFRRKWSYSLQTTLRYRVQSSPRTLVTPTASSRATL